MSISELLAYSDADVKAVRNIIAPDAPDEIIRLVLYRCKTLGCDPLGRFIYAINRPKKKLGFEAPSCPGTMPNGAKCTRKLRKSTFAEGGWYCNKKSNPAGCGWKCDDDHPLVAGLGADREDNWVLQSSIDFFRSQAESSEEYAGQRGPFWCGRDGDWKDVWIPTYVGESITWPIAARVGVLRHSFTEILWTVVHMYEYGTTDGLWPTRAASQLGKCCEAVGLRRGFPRKLNGIYIPEEFRDSDESEEETHVAAAALNVAPIALPPGLQSAAEVLGIMPRGIEEDLRKHGGDTAALEAVYVERVAKKQHQHARPIETTAVHAPSVPPKQDSPQAASPEQTALEADLNDFAEPKPQRNAVKGLMIEFGRPAAKALFPTREARMAFTREVVKRDIKSANDLFDEELIAVSDALRERIASDGPTNTETIDCPACGTPPGSPHFASCNLAA